VRSHSRSPEITFQILYLDHILSFFLFFSRTVADLFGLARRECNVRKIQPDTVPIEYVQIGFKDQVR